jgi:hypothetical protein
MSSPRSPSQKQKDNIDKMPSIDTKHRFISFFLLPSLALAVKFIFYLFYFIIHNKIRLGSFLPPAPTPSLTTHSAPSLCPLIPSIPCRNYFALISNFVEERV